MDTSELESKRCSDFFGGPKDSNKILSSCFEIYVKLSLVLANKFNKHNKIWFSNHRLIHHTRRNAYQTQIRYSGNLYETQTENKQTINIRRYT